MHIFYLFWLSFLDLPCAFLATNNQRSRTEYICQSILETWSNKIDKAQNKSRSQKLLPQFHGNGMSFAYFFYKFEFTDFWMIFFVFLILARISNAIGNNSASIIASDGVVTWFITRKWIFGRCSIELKWTKSERRIGWLVYIGLYYTIIETSAFIFMEKKSNVKPNQCATCIRL